MNTYIFICLKLLTIFQRVAEKMSQKVCESPLPEASHPLELPPILPMMLSFPTATQIHRNPEYGYPGLKIAIWGFVA